MTNPSSTGRSGAPIFDFNRAAERIRHRADLDDTMMGRGA